LWKIFGIGKIARFHLTNLFKGGLANSNRNNNHQSKWNMEEPKKRKIHGTEIMLPKQLLNLNPSGPTDYN